MALASSVPATSGSVPGVPDERTITVLGEAEEYATPDRCHLHFALNVMKPTVGEAISEVAALADRVIAVMDDHGVPETERQTVSLWVQDYFDHEKRQITARVGSYALRVSVAVAEVGSILGAIAEVAGDSLQVRGLQLAISDPAPLRANARRRAVDDAEARAMQLAEAAHVRLGPLLALREPPGRGPIVGAPARTFAASVPGQAPQVPVEGGSVTVSVQVMATFAVES